MSNNVPAGVALPVRLESSTTGSAVYLVDANDVVVSDAKRPQDAHYLKHLMLILNSAVEVLPIEVTEAERRYLVNFELVVNQAHYEDIKDEAGQYPNDDHEIINRIADFARDLVSVVDYDVKRVGDSYDKP